MIVDGWDPRQNVAAKGSANSLMHFQLYPLRLASGREIYGHHSTLLFADIRYVVRWMARVSLEPVCHASFHVFSRTYGCRGPSSLTA